MTRLACCLCLFSLSALAARPRSESSMPPLESENSNSGPHQRYFAVDVGAGFFRYPEGLEGPGTSLETGVQIGRKPSRHLSVGIEGWVGLSAGLTRGTLLTPRYCLGANVAWNVLALFVARDAALSNLELGPELTFGLSLWDLSFALPMAVPGIMVHYQVDPQYAVGARARSFFGAWTGTFAERAPLPVTVTAELVRFW
jgi:hypothetical protein